ncbi:mannose-1-phosphate guanylyltransferase [Porphyromonas cangingivalis]|uniref:Mannose-1-phosphate guanylyltransferase n=1 Tax=Porphyromonas cangingivalis TaxID=36874 RepID=A0A1T4MP41_PORCN|nr:mannose-1-phosphate guanylyltransferase [Porphyromonas cangingivalis]SJZ68564.1 mannose-1-phosphate guanylyltransferase [Porphyromonas cangingivalis]VEJ03695.1 Mannose-1-phosphate guanylyltransferase 1 [Porphyromonas cangingivalis]
MTLKQNIYCVIMAGGIGARFWPMSRQDKPKQFLDILGTGFTMLQDTCHRFESIVQADNFFVVTGEKFGGEVMRQLHTLPPHNILTEPERRNTAPCIAYAAYKIYATDPNAIMIVTPSDHHIGDVEAFRQCLVRGVEYVSQNDVLLTIGIPPTFPATSYGYIEQGDEALETGRGAIVRFKEKPQKEEAEALLASGRYVWNSGMFVWKVKDIVAALETYLPEVAALFANIKSYNTTSERTDVAQAFLNSKSISIDYGVMEKADNVHVLSGDFGWDDIGTWESLYRHVSSLPSGENPNHKLENSPHTLVRVSNPDKQVIVSGLDNYVVVDMDDVLVIAPKGDEATLHDLLNKHAKNL